MRHLGDHAALVHRLTLLGLAPSRQQLPTRTLRGVLRTQRRRQQHGRDGSERPHGRRRPAPQRQGDRHGVAGVRGGDPVVEVARAQQLSELPADHARQQPAEGRQHRRRPAERLEPLPRHDSEPHADQGTTDHVPGVRRDELGQRALGDDRPAVGHDRVARQHHDARPEDRRQCPHDDSEHREHAEPREQLRKPGPRRGLLPEFLLGQRCRHDRNATR